MIIKRWLITKRWLIIEPGGCQMSGNHLNKLILYRIFGV